MWLSLKKLTKHALAFAVIIISIEASAQDDFLKMNYDWDPVMPSFSIPDSLNEEPQIYFKKYEVSEYGFENEKFVQIQILHEIFWVNSDEAIDKNNKVYIPMGKGTEVILTKARVINPDGNRVELNEDDVKELTDEDDNVAHYFALKGIEIGSFIEYFYVIKTAPNYKGSRRVAQEMAPVFNYEFHLISPDHLIFATKSYNGFGELDKDSFDEEHNHLMKEIAYIPKFVKEDQAYNLPNRMAIIYKLDENTANNSSNLVSYNDLAKSFIQNYTVPEKSDIKPFKKMMKEAAIDPTASKEEIIRALERYFKTNFSIYQANSPDLINMGFVYKNKVSNSPGLWKFMAMGCDQYNITYRLVFACNRKSQAFDEKFQSYSFLQKYLMYFPQVDKYMDVEEKFSALGLVDYHYQDNFGLFFKKVVVGDIISATTKIQWLTAPDAEASHSDMDMKITVADDFSTLNFDLTTSGTGYNVDPVQPYFGLMDADKEQELIEQLIKFVDEDMDLHEVSAKNKGYEHLGVDPLLITGTFSIDKFIVSIKDKYLIKLGLFIGPQTEMYQKGEARKFPVDMGYRKNYHRVLKFEVPEGYKVTNLETLNMKVEGKEDDGTVYADFISTYSLDGNVLTVTCNERYHKIHIPIEQYEGYRSVVNAAADFNKIVVYLEEN